MHRIRNVHSELPLAGSRRLHRQSESRAIETQSQFVHFVKYEKCPQSQAISFRFNRCSFSLSLSLALSLTLCAFFSSGIRRIVSGECSGGASICDKRYIRMLNHILLNHLKLNDIFLQFHFNNNVPALRSTQPTPLRRLL